MKRVGLMVLAAVFAVTLAASTVYRRRDDFRNARRGRLRRHGGRGTE